MAEETVKQEGEFTLKNKKVKPKENRVVFFDPH